MSGRKAADLGGRFRLENIGESELLTRTRANIEADAARRPRARSAGRNLGQRCNPSFTASLRPLQAQPRSH